MKNIGIVCEGPTDYMILKMVTDRITGEDQTYFLLQPEPDLKGQYGNGWKGVWKWCRDHASIKEKLMKDIEPALDILIIQMDGDVSRKEKSAHCHCISTACEYKEIRNPLECDINQETRAFCPVILPCSDHVPSVNGYINHLESLIETWLTDLSDTCIVIPCDSIEAWIVAAYDKTPNAELIEDPWSSVIARKKSYHGIRIAGDKKRKHVYEQFAEIVCANWADVTEICFSARRFEEDLRILTAV